MKIIGIDPGKSGAIFIYETEPDGPRGGENWFAHTFAWKPWQVIRIPLIVPPSILTRTLDKKGKRKRKQPKSKIDWHALAKEFQSVVRMPNFVPGKVHAFIEKVTGSQGQGAQTGSFNFGMVYGFLLGLLEGENIPATFVRPQEWKAAVGIVSVAGQVAKKTKKTKLPKGKKAPAVKATEDKNVSRKLATKFFPDAADQWALAKEDGVAESALIAQYGCQILGVDL